MEDDKRSMNVRSELLSKCRHRAKWKFIHEYSEAIKAEWQTLDHEINIRKQVFLVKYTYIKHTIEHT